MHTKYSPCSNIGEHAYGIFVYISIIQEESFFHPAKYPKKGGGAAKIIIEERRFLKKYILYWEAMFLYGTRSQKTMVISWVC